VAVVMAIKHAVLGLLLERRGYGYELLKRLEGRLGPSWQLNPSTVYAALDQLEEEGLISGKRVQGSAEEGEAENRVRRGGRRVVYEATEPGRSAFEAWISRPPLQVKPIRDELQLRMIVAREKDLPALRRAIDHARLLTEELYEECLGGAPPTDSGGSHGLASGLGRGVAVFQLEAQLRWLESASQALEKLPPA
jgi:DNA-binding PadR family transcriptional regulator